MDMEHEMLINYIEKGKNEYGTPYWESIRYLRKVLDEIEMEYEEKENIRCCSECGKSMTKGYVIEDGLEYYCSDECLHKNYTEEEFDKLYENGNGSSYWTEWED